MPSRRSHHGSQDRERREGPQETWSDHHTEAMFRGIVTLVLNNRSSLYAIPQVSGVNGNGGDRINKKVQQVLKKVCEGQGVPGLVDDELKNLKASKGGNGGSPKKRKVEAEE
ncbi:hypothetical protein IAU60_004128 [Kwoniella sp. DSM 27419]